MQTQLIKLVCRITKLGWFDDTTHRELAEEVTKFLQASVDHCILGLRILNQLVDELNIPTSGRTITQHRKTAVSFRDVSLFRVFQLGLTTLGQLQSNSIQAPQGQLATLGEQSICLCVRCLSFDFIGTNPDESSEDVGTIQIPSNWKSVIQDSDTMSLFLHFYSNYDPPRSSKAMEALILLCSCRRSLFSTDRDRADFLQRVMNGITNLLKNQTGFQHEDNYHQVRQVFALFCFAASLWYIKCLLCMIYLFLLLYSFLFYFGRYVARRLKCGPFPPLTHLFPIALLPASFSRSFAASSVVSRQITSSVSS